MKLSLLMQQIKQSYRNEQTQPTDGPFGAFNIGQLDCRELSGKVPK